MFSIDINYVGSKLRKTLFTSTTDVLDEAKWEEAKHPRGKSGEHGGQFVSKGQGGGSAYPPNKYKQHVKPMGLLESVAKKQLGSSPGTPEVAANTIKAIVAMYSHPTIAAYGNSLIGWLEKEHGLKSGELGKSESKTIAPEQKKQFKATVAKQVAQPHTPASSQEVSVPEESAKTKLSDVQKIDDIVLTATNPVHAAVAVKKIGENSLLSSVKSHAKETLAELLKYNPSKEAELKQVMGVASEPAKEVEPPAKEVKPTESAELPKPYDSPHQNKLYEIATSQISSEQKIADIKAYPVVQQYPEGYTAKYAAHLVEALGGKMDTPKPNVVPPPAPPKPAATNTIVPDTPTESWKAGMALLQSAVKNDSVTWSKAQAKKCMPTDSTDFWHSKVTPEQLNACTTYIGSSGSINAALRHPETASKSAIDSVKAIDALFQREESKTTEAMVVHRGMPLIGSSGEQLIPIDSIKAALKLGLPAAFKWDGFVSSSFATGAAFAGQDMQVEIGVPKGTPALAWGGSIGLGHENEVLLPHGRSYQVLSIETHGARHKLKVVML